MSRIAPLAAALSIALFTMGCTASTRQSDVPTDVASPTTEQATTDDTPRRVEVADGAGKAPFDDLRFSPTLRRVLVAPGNARFSLIEPATLGRTPLGSVSRSTRSSDEARGLVVAADGDTNDVVVIDPASDRLLGRAKIAAAPDYVRWSASTSEVWVTEPARAGIEIFSLPEGSTTPVSTGFVSVEGGPEG